MPPALQPTAFRFTTQSNAQDACVLLLIQTNGQPGTVAPLASYPIPDGHTAALLIAERTLFAGALPEALTQSFAQFGPTFHGRQSAGGWSSVCSGGNIDCGTFGQVQGFNSSDRTPWSGTGNALEHVGISLDGLTLSASQGKLVAALSNKQGPQNWTRMTWTPPISKWGIGMNMPLTRPAYLQVDCKMTGSPAVDPVTDQVSFAGEPQCSVAAADRSFIEWFTNESVPAVIATAMQDQAMKPVFKKLALPSLNTFALASLLFPSEHAVQLKDVALPKDLYLTGTLVQRIAVTPAESTMKPGDNIQFGAAGASASDVLWQIHPKIGAISATGLYTAPSRLSAAEIVVITATRRSDASAAGRAMVLVYQSPAVHGVAVTPDTSLVTTGQTVQLSTTDETGKPVAVTWTLSPNIGQIAAGFNEGQYAYTGPDSVAQATKVQLTAAAANAKTGSAVIYVAAPGKIAVQPAQASAKLGGSVALTATVTADDRDFLRWVVYPPDAGKIAFDPGDPAKASYTAPAALPKAGHTVHVVAYVARVADDPVAASAGAGLAAITLTS